ncbi:ycgB domain protein, partial [Escherichia coli DEC12B]
MNRKQKQELKYFLRKEIARLEDAESQSSEIPFGMDINDARILQAYRIAQAALQAKPSDGLVRAVRFYELVKRENPPVETGAWKDAVDWVLKEACHVVNIGIKEGDMATNNRKAKILLVRRNDPGVWQWVRLSNRRMGLMKYYGMMDCGFCKKPSAAQN